MHHWVELLEQGHQDLMPYILGVFKVGLWEKALTCSLSLSLLSLSLFLFLQPTHSHFFLNIMHSASLPCASSLQILVSYDLRSYSTTTPSDTPTPNHPRTGEYWWWSYLNTKKTSKRTRTTATPPTITATFQQELHHYITSPIAIHLSQPLRQLPTSLRSPEAGKHLSLCPLQQTHPSSCSATCGNLGCEPEVNSSQVPRHSHDPWLGLGLGLGLRLKLRLRSRLRLRAG